MSCILRDTLGKQNVSHQGRQEQVLGVTLGSLIDPEGGDDWVLDSGVFLEN